MMPQRILVGVSRYAAITDLVVFRCVFIVRFVDQCPIEYEIIMGVFTGPHVLGGFEYYCFSVFFVLIKMKFNACNSEVSRPISIPSLQQYLNVRIIGLLVKFRYYIISSPSAAS